MRAKNARRSCVTILMPSSMVAADAYVRYEIRGNPCPELFVTGNRELR